MGSRLEGSNSRERLAEDCADSFDNPIFSRTDVLFQRRAIGNRHVERGDAADWRFALDIGLTKANRRVVVRHFAADLQKLHVIDKDRRVIAGNGSFEESFHISWRRGQDDLKSRIVPKHRLRAGGVLRGAAAAKAVKEVENHGHTGLPGRHGKSIGGFVADLWPAFENE